MKPSDFKYPLKNGNPMKLDLSSSRPMFPKSIPSAVTISGALSKDNRTIDSIAQAFKEKF